MGIDQVKGQYFKCTVHHQIQNEKSTNVPDTITDSHGNRRKSVSVANVYWTSGRKDLMRLISGM